MSTTPQWKQQFEDDWFDRKMDGEAYIGEQGLTSDPECEGVIKYIEKNILPLALQQERQKIEKDVLEITATGFDCICQPKVLEYFNSLDQPNKE